eukprot:1066063-Pleurochrysis_carterae.AAC.2
MACLYLVHTSGYVHCALQGLIDARRPLFWAYEFKNMEALALLLHMGADDDAEDADGKRPRDFFPDGAEELSGARHSTGTTTKQAWVVGA